MGLDSTDEVGCSVPVLGLRCFLGTGDLMSCLGNANGDTLALFFLFRVHLCAISLLLLACSRCELLLASVFTCASQELSPTVLKGAVARKRKQFKFELHNKGVSETIVRAMCMRIVRVYARAHR